MTVATKDNIEEILNADKLTVVKFGASWCPPCKVLTPILNEISNEITDVNFVDVDVDDETELSLQYGIKNVPTLIFFKNGKVLEKKVGSLNKSDLLKKIEELN